MLNTDSPDILSLSLSLFLSHTHTHTHTVEVNRNIPSFVSVIRLVDNYMNESDMST